MTRSFVWCVYSYILDINLVAFLFLSRVFFALFFLFFFSQACVLFEIFNFSLARVSLQIISQKRKIGINRTRRTRIYTHKRTNASETESERETRDARLHEEALVSKQRGDY